MTIGIVAPALDIGSFLEHDAHVISSSLDIPNREARSQIHVRDVVSHEIGVISQGIRGWLLLSKHTIAVGSETLHTIVVENNAGKCIAKREHSRLPSIAKVHGNKGIGKQGCGG